MEGATSSPPPPHPPPPEASRKELGQRPWTQALGLVERKGGQPRAGTEGQQLP